VHQSVKILWKSFRKSKYNKRTVSERRPIVFLATDARALYWRNDAACAGAAQCVRRSLWIQLCRCHYSFHKPPSKLTMHSRINWISIHPLRRRHRHWVTFLSFKQNHVLPRQVTFQPFVYCHERLLYFSSNSWLRSVSCSRHGAAVRMSQKGIHPCVHSQFWRFHPIFHLLFSTQVRPLTMIN